MTPERRIWELMVKFKFADNKPLTEAEWEALAG